MFTATRGYYNFDNLADGDFVVRLAPSNFQNIPGSVLVDGNGSSFSSSESGGVLESTYLSDNQSDNNDNGFDENFPSVNGIVSTAINLTAGAEPQASGNADLTIDFGVYSPTLSIGNRVFNDRNNNRIFDGVDSGVDGVVLNLYRDFDQNGLPDTSLANPIATTETHSGGYYIFDSLVGGYYLVQVAPQNFDIPSAGPLRESFSSFDQGVTPADDMDDAIENGVDNPDPQSGGVFSPTIQLISGSEATGETDRGPEGDGEPNIQDSSSNLTVDFGFYRVAAVPTLPGYALVMIILGVLLVAFCYFEQRVSVIRGHLRGTG